MKFLSCFVMLLLGYFWITALAMLQMFRNTRTLESTAVRNQMSVNNQVTSISMNEFNAIFSGGRLNVRKFIDFCRQ